MISTVDEALRRLVRTDALDGSDVDVAFDAPTKDWSARRSVPTVDLYLYDIREDLRRRERGLTDVADEEGRVVSRRQAPRHFKLSYLVTAWTQRPEDEHRLLSAILTCFLRHEALPESLVVGPLAATGLPVPLTIALPPPEDRAFADVWSALGGELKPSLDLVVAVPVDTGIRYVAGPPVVEGPILDVVDRTGTGADRGWQRRRGGRDTGRVAPIGTSALVGGTVEATASAGRRRAGRRTRLVEASGPPDRDEPS